MASWYPPYPSLYLIGPRFMTCVKSHLTADITQGSATIVPILFASVPRSRRTDGGGKPRFAGARGVTLRHEICGVVCSGIRRDDAPRTWPSQEWPRLKTGFRA